MTVEIVKSESVDASLKIDLLSPPQSATDSTKQLSSDSSITSSPNSKSIDENPKSPSDETKHKLNTSSASDKSDKNNSTDTSTATSNTAKSEVVSPNHTNQTRVALKRARESSCDDHGPNDSLDNDRSKSPEQPVAKKVSYSIMNILGKEKEVETKKTSQQPSMNPDICALIQQQLASGTANGMNQFLMNPFLAAAAAFSQNSNNHHQQQSQLPPWMNMATMSSLYGLEKGVSLTNNNTNGLPSASELQNLQLQRQYQQHTKRTNYSQSSSQSTSSLSNQDSPATQELPAASNTGNPNTQLQLQIGQLVNNILQQQQHAHIEADLQNKRENEKQQTGHFNGSNLLIKSEQNKPKNDSRMNVSDSSHSSSPLSLTPPLNQRYLIANEMRGLEEQRQKQFNGRLFMDNADQARKSFSNEESGKSYTNNNGGGASLDDDSDNEDNLEDDDDDLDENGDSFDNGHRKKKTRTVFSRNQVFQLESTFDMKRYLSSSERSSLANSLQLTETQIKIWFQNRRNKWKRQLAAEIEANTNMPTMNQQVASQHHLDSSNRVPFPRNNNTPMSQNTNQTRNNMNHRLPVLFNTNQANDNSLEQSQNNHMASSGSNSSLSSSSTRSSLSSPSQNLQNNFSNPSALLNMVHGQNGAHFNPAMLTPQMLAAAAAASSLYYAATGTQSPQSTNPAFAQFAALSNSQSNNSKQSLSGML